MRIWIRGKFCQFADDMVIGVRKWCKERPVRKTQAPVSIRHLKFKRRYLSLESEVLDQVYSSKWDEDLTISGMIISLFAPYTAKIMCHLRF